MIAAIFVLAIFFSCLLAFLCDIDCAIHDALVDELWDDGE